VHVFGFKICREGDVAIRPEHTAGSNKAATLQLSAEDSAGTILASNAMQPKEGRKNRRDV
jgi:hypothetical protein